jgi:hypothetical protein
VCVLNDWREKPINLDSFKSCVPQLICYIHPVLSVVLFQGRIVVDSRMHFCLSFQQKNSEISQIWDPKWI